MNNFRVFFAANGVAIIFVFVRFAWSLSSFMCASIKAVKGQTTTKTAALGWLNRRSCKYAHTLGKIWKIKDFPDPVGSTANTSFHLMKWSNASSWTGFNSRISEKLLSNANCAAPRKGRSNSLPSSAFFFVWSFFEPGCKYLLLCVSKLEVFTQLPPDYHENSWTSMVSYKDFLQ